jgi:hypothetical protein
MRAHEIALFATSLLAPLSAAALAEAPREAVSYLARTGSGSTIWVDVENDSDDDIEITSVVLTFYDSRGRLLSKTTVDCDEDCVVSADTAVSFGPFDGPPGWAAVVATKLHYETLPPEDTAPGRPVARLESCLLPGPV